MKTARANIVVQGMVQGVGFRYYACHHAERLGLFGYVQNLYNGDVEIEVEGDPGMIQTLIDAVKVGPRSSRVTNAIVNWKEPRGEYHSFNITG